jgi:hypothetical protein
MTHPVGITTRRYSSDRSRVEPLAQELREYVIPILHHHTEDLRHHRAAIVSLGVATQSGFYNAQSHASYLHGRVDVQSENLRLANQRIDELTTRLADQTEEIRRLRDLPCNRLQRAASNMCTYL